MIYLEKTTGERVPQPDMTHSILNILIRKGQAMCIIRSASVTVFRMTNVKPPAPEKRMKYGGLSRYDRWGWNG